jgi:sialic acid synthase SpsE/protoporphyrinogen oxidase
MKNKSDKKKVYILGAGPIGLVCGWKLAENGYNVTIYEKNNRVGGMCASWQWKDFILDIGPHIFHTPDKMLTEFWKREFGHLMQEGDFYCQNVQGESFDKFYNYPLSWEELSNFPKKNREKIIAEIEGISDYQKATAKSYKDYMDAQVGPTLRSMFYEKYPEKIWGIKTSELTADWAPKRIKFRQKISPFYENEWVAVGKNGTGAIYESIAEKIIENEGGIIFNKTVSAVDVNNDIIKTLKFSDGEEVEISTDDIIISSIPITIMSKFFGYDSNLKFRGVRLAYIAIKKESVLPNDMNWLYYDSDKVLFNRVSEPKTMAPDIASNDKTVLVAEVTYSKGDAIDQLSDQDFLDKIIEDLEQVSLVSKSDVYASLSHKEDFVYPIQDKDYQQELVKTRSILNRFSQLYSLGTGGDFNYADSQILFHMAFDTVSNICGKGSNIAQTIREVVPVKQNKVVEIAGRKIGDGYPPFIIAEAGMNHNGSLDLAFKLIDEAIKSKCPVIKFQSFIKGGRVSAKMKNANYAEKAEGLEENIYEMFDRLSMSFDKQREIFKYARKQGIEVFSTPFDEGSVDFLESQNVKLYKIASMDLVNLPLLRYVAKTMKPLILSTGMSTLSNIEDAVNAILSEGNPNIILLHCNSSYPATENEMNLSAINTLKQSFKTPVGLSDHTFGLFVSHTAIAIGANVVERHFTLSRTMEGPDHILSSEPGEMATLVEMSSRIPNILGDGIKSIQPNEYITLNSQRKCLYAKSDIKAGEVVSLRDIVIKGPGGGIMPKYINIVIGRTACQDIESDTPITWDNI